MNDTSTNGGPYTPPHKRELSPGSKLRFWKQAFLANMQSGTTAGVAAYRADEAVWLYNAKFRELFPS